MTPRLDNRWARTEGSHGSHEHALLKLDTPAFLPPEVIGEPTLPPSSSSPHRQGGRFVLMDADTVLVLPSSAAELWAQFSSRPNSESEAAQHQPQQQSQQRSGKRHSQQQQLKQQKQDDQEQQHLTPRFRMAIEPSNMYAVACKKWWHKRGRSPLQALAALHMRRSILGNGFNSGVVLWDTTLTVATAAASVSPVVPSLSSSSLPASWWHSTLVALRRDTCAQPAAPPRPLTARSLRTQHAARSRQPPPPSSTQLAAAKASTAATSPPALAGAVALSEDEEHRQKHKVEEAKVAAHAASLGLCSSNNVSSPPPPSPPPPISSLPSPNPGGNKSGGGGGGGGGSGGEGSAFLFTADQDLFNLFAANSITKGDNPAVGVLGCEFNSLWPSLSFLALSLKVVRLANASTDVVMLGGMQNTRQGTSFCVPRELQCPRFPRVLHLTGAGSRYGPRVLKKLRQHAFKAAGALTAATSSSVSRQAKKQGEVVVHRNGGDGGGDDDDKAGDDKAGGGEDSTAVLLRATAHLGERGKPLTSSSLPSLWSLTPSALNALVPWLDCGRSHRSEGPTACPAGYEWSSGEGCFNFCHDSNLCGVTASDEDLKHHFHQRAQQ